MRDEDGEDVDGLIERYEQRIHDLQVDLAVSNAHLFNVVRQLGGSLRVSSLLGPLTRAIAYCKGTKAWDSSKVCVRPPWLN